MKSITLILLVLFAFINAHGQTFSSGSTGIDQAFNPPGSVPLNTSVQGNCTSGSPCVVTVPLRPPNAGQPIHANGAHVFNFTTVNIGQFVTVRFTRNAANTPVFILATGNVTINGLIDVSGTTAGDGLFVGQGGPGGFNGGGGARVSAPTNFGGAGSGPGGGDPSAPGNFSTGSAALLYGVPELQPIIGGSGGAGSGRLLFPPPPSNGRSGSGGGGAILIASSGTIDLGTGATLAIIANGGNGFLVPFGFGASKPGSGGAIRLIGSSVRGSRPLVALGGRINPASSTDLTTAGNGRIRIESVAALLYTGTSTPQASTLLNGDPFFGTPIRVFAPITPTLRIVSIGGAVLPNQTTADVTTPDVSLPNNFTNPVTIVVEGINVPSGTTFEIFANPQFGSGPRVIVSTGVLLGNPGQVKTATVSVNLPPTGVGIISAVIRTPIVPEPSSSLIN
jgi:hypothetical protein